MSSFLSRHSLPLAGGTAWCTRSKYWLALPSRCGVLTMEHFSSISMIFFSKCCVSKGWPWIADVGCYVCHRELRPCGGLSEMSQCFHWTEVIVKQKCWCKFAFWALTNTKDIFSLQTKTLIKMVICKKNNPLLLVSSFWYCLWVRYFFYC